MAIHRTWHLLALFITMLATPKIEVSSLHAALVIFGRAPP